MTAIACHAQQGDNVVVNTVSGKKVYQTESVSKMTFKGGKLTVEQKGAAADVYDMADVTNVTFDLTSGIGKVKADGGRLTISSAPGSHVIHVDGYDGSRQYAVAVYSASGTVALRIDRWTGAPIDVGTLPSGVYILKIGESTIKFRK